MNPSKSYLQSSIGQKQLVAVTGLALSLFVLVHMAGNLLMFVSPQKYNEYGHGIISNPLVYGAEAGLLLALLAHMAMALRLTVKNWAARPQRYAVSASGAKATSMTTKSMWLQGLVILVFIILHLITFKFGPHYSVNYGSGEIRDLFRLVVEVFQSPIYVAWYIVALVILGMHLSHGVQSVVQTFGVHHPKYQCKIKMVSWGFALLVAIGFIAQPIYVFFFHQG